MSMPRKAMQELGFQACCLRCDAPDQPGVSRCGPCIQHHRAVRETLAAAPPDDPLYQLAKEIMAMAADPHRYDHDEVHGDSLIEQQRLAAALVGAPAPRTSDDISAVFEVQRSTAKANMLRDVGNQNPWRDAPMQAADAKKVAEETWLLNPDVDQHYGARTIPSKPIAKKWTEVNELAKTQRSPIEFTPQRLRPVWMRHRPRFSKTWTSSNDSVGVKR